MNTPFQAVLAETVQVILGWRGQELHMAVRENLTEKVFKKEAKKRLSFKGHVRIEPQGLSAWEVKAGYLYTVMETRKLGITLHDQSGRAHRIQVEGDKSALGLEGMIRDAWKLEPGVIVAGRRSDGKPFWVEEKGDYMVATQYDPSLETRPEISLRVDLADRSFVVEKYRAPEDPGVLLDDLSTKFGFRPLDRGD
jgi:hypothetical protein